MINDYSRLVVRYFFMSTSTRQMYSSTSTPALQLKSGTFSWIRVRVQTNVLEYKYYSSIVEVRYFFLSTSTDKCTRVQVLQLYSWSQVLFLEWVRVRVQTNVLEYKYSSSIVVVRYFFLSTSTSTDKCTRVQVLQLYSCSQVLFHEYEYEYRQMYSSTSTTAL